MATRRGRLTPIALLVIPPIYDFKAYDFWLKFTGLLKIASTLQDSGWQIYFFDFLDRSHPWMASRSKPGTYGRGKYYAVEVPKPTIFKTIARRFKRYGLPKQIFEQFLNSIPKPDYVFIAGGMTYWYLGVKEVVEIVRSHYPNTNVVVGGVYPTLMPNHARKLEVDHVVVGNDMSLFDKLGIKSTAATPLWRLYPKLTYGVINFTYGCPLNCTYCAARKLHEQFIIRDWDIVADELLYFGKLGITDIAIYDDALLFKAKEILPKLLDLLHRYSLKFRFHTPNGLHVRLIDRDTANLMRVTGFTTIFLSYETHNLQRQQLLGNKVTEEELISAIEVLRSVGYTGCDLIVYLLAGLVDQPAPEVEEGIHFLHKLGVSIMLSEFSPIPGTPEGEKACQIIDMDEPLCHNNLYFTTLVLGDHSLQQLKSLKNHYNRIIRSTCTSKT